MAGPAHAEDLEKRACNGDPRAQYELAALRQQEGRTSEADHWLSKAADAGEPDALYTLATRELQSLTGAPRARSLLEKASRKGAMAARRLLAVLQAEGIGAVADWAGALATVLDAAKRDDPAAMREIGGLLILLDADDQSGSALIAAAADRNPVAGAVHVARAIAGRAASAPSPQAIADKLKAINYPRADELRRGLAGASLRPSSAAVDWNRIAARLAEPSPPAPAAERLSRSPDVSVVRRAAPPELLEYVIAVGAQHLGPSMTFDPISGAARVDPYRTSATATLGPVDQDLFLVALNRRLAAVAGVAAEQGEFLSVLRYLPGDQYKPHFDWIPETSEDFSRGGQRTRTALLYLNDDYEGGETEFLANGLKFKGAPGDVLVFSNIRPDGSPDQACRHAGLPVRSGVKWLGSKWFRERPYRF
jgi:TPR repeat protein